jgi:enoyl-CoA hydratase/carnithine racemase
MTEEKTVVAKANKSAPRRKAATAPRRDRKVQPASRDGAIAITLEAGCLIATLNRPKAHNRVSQRMGQELMELAETVEDDEAILAFAITGAGAAFCGGFDAGVDSRLVETLALISKPTVAIVNGDAYDEGLELALALDLRAALVSARFALTQLRRGSLPHFGGTQRLPRLIGATHGLLMILTGQPLSGQEAMRLGLVTYLAGDRKELDRVARELLANLTSRGSLGVRMVKDAVRKGYDMTIEQGIRLEEDLYALLQTSADRAEGVKAFLEKRRPLFKGA